MFRPTIKGTLEEQMDKYMEIAGFDDKADFTRYCVRKELERLRQQKITMEGER